jgi:hypothetical protein
MRPGRAASDAASADAGYSAEEVRRLLAVVPGTVPGRRDGAILLALILTGTRGAEEHGRGAGGITLRGRTAF